MEEKKRIKWIKILSKGVITVPKKFREKLGIKDGDVVKSWVEKGAIVIKPQEEKIHHIEHREVNAGEKDPSTGSEQEPSSEEWITFEKKGE
jgi:AbrB family looped-hinge helix DNA binding protein